MNFKDRASQGSCMKEAEMLGQAAPKPPQSLLVRVSELEAALESAAKALQDMFNRINRVESTLGL